MLIYLLLISRLHPQVMGVGLSAPSLYPPRFTVDPSAGARSGIPPSKYRPVWSPRRLEIGVPPPPPSSPWAIHPAPLSRLPPVIDQITAFYPEAPKAFHRDIGKFVTPLPRRRMHVPDERRVGACALRRYRQLVNRGSNIASSHVYVRLRMRVCESDVH